MSKEHPIIFSTNMVKAILDGRKTQTRRVITQQPSKLCFDGRKGLYLIGKNLVERFDKNNCVDVTDKNKKQIKSRYQIGDILWVREAWHLCPHTDKERYCYRADGCGAEPNAPSKWKPSIHMTRWVSRITLEITDVQVERLQDITYEESISEGLIECNIGPLHVIGWSGTKEEKPTMNPIKAFSRLWNSINEKRGYGWNTNPWVFVITFKKLEPK